MERFDWIVQKLVFLERSDWLVQKVVRIEQSDWLVKRVFRMERSDWLVRKVLLMERSFWLVRKVLHMEQSDLMARLLGPERSDPIGCPGDLSSSAFAGLLVLQNFRQKCRRQQETDERNASCSAT